MPVTLAVLMVLVAGAACEGSSSGDGEETSAIISAEQVGGKQTGQGTDLLKPAIPICDADGGFLWGSADDSEVRGFERQTDDGHTEDIVVGAWPMPEDAALAALDRIDLYQDACLGGRFAVEGEPMIGRPSQSFSVREYAKPLSTDIAPGKRKMLSWTVRLYTYAEGHMITVWVDRTGDDRPNLDDMIDLLRQQEELLAEHA